MPHVLRQWLSDSSEAVGRHKLLSLSEIKDARKKSLALLRSTVRGHYVSSQDFEARLKALGAPNTAKLLKEMLPRGKSARSGDLGEILATEIAEEHIKFPVPIRRLRWKDGREMALRGDDLIGVVATVSSLRILKGESKSGIAVAKNVIDNAAAALDANRGRPNRHSVLFVASRLREQGKDTEATRLEAALLDSFRQAEIEHLLFLLSGNDTTEALKQHLTNIARKRLRRHAVTIRVDDHADFVASVFRDL